MPQAGLIGGSSQQESLPFDAQRTLNYLVIVDQDGKTPSALISRPGLNFFGTVGIGPGRGGLTAQNGRVFIVSGSGFYEINGDGTSTLWGNLDQTSGIVTSADNGFQFAICDGTSLYIFTYATNAFLKVVTPNLPSAATVTFQDGYFIINKSFTSGIFQISAPFDGTSWAALDFATAESSPDALYRVISVSGQLWLVGAISIEIWSNTGAADFPFQRLNSSAKMSVGTVAPFSVVELDNSMFWVGRDLNGNGIVYRADGFSPKRISTDPIDIRIQNAPDPFSLRANTYQEAGHTYYKVTGGGMETELCLDLATNIWTENCFLNDTGNYELPLPTCLFSAFNETLALDKNNGNIYVQSLDYYSDNGAEIARDRIFTHIFNHAVRFRIKNLAVYIESGVGNENPPYDNPQALLFISQDGGKTFGKPFIGFFGKVGKFMERGLMFWRLGSYFQATFRFRVTDSVKVCVSGADFNIG